MKKHIWRIKFKFRNPDYPHRPVFFARMLLATRSRELVTASQDFKRFIGKLSDKYPSPEVMKMKYLGILES